MSWADQVDQLLTTVRDTFGDATVYQRPGFAPFSIVGVPKFLARLENVNEGQFYSIFYKIADFASAPFTASLQATFTGPPNVDGVITFAGVSYADVLTLDNSTPNQFLRGSSALGAAANLSACINADPAVAGVLFSSSTTPHPTCSAQWVDNGNGTASVIVSALQAGADADSWTAIDQMSYVTLDSKWFYGGGPMDNDLITLKGVLYRVSDIPQPDPDGSVQLRLEKKA